MPNPIVHWEIVSPENGKRLQEFYRGLFGWKMDTNNPYEYGIAETETDGRGINGGVGATEGPGRVTIYAEVDNLQATLDKAVSLGGKVAMEPTEIPGAVTMAMFTDPEGNYFGLVKSGSMQTQG